MRSGALRVGALALALLVGGCSGATLRIDALGISILLVVHPHDTIVRL